MKKSFHFLTMVIAIGLVVGYCEPRVSDFEIKGDTAYVTKLLGEIIVLNQTLIDIADHMRDAMKTVMQDEKLNRVKFIRLNYEVKNKGDDHFRVAALIIPLADWKQIPKAQREKSFWIACNLERWKKFIHWEVVGEVRKMKRKFNY